jgi:hypothetical protein
MFGKDENKEEEIKRKACQALLPVIIYINE